MYAKFTTTSLLIVLVSGIVARAGGTTDKVIQCSASEAVGPAFPRLGTTDEFDTIVKVEPFRMVALQRLPKVEGGVEQVGLTYDDPTLEPTPPLPPDDGQPTIAKTCQQCSPMVCGECYQCCPCCPKWTFRTGAVFLDRNGPANIDLIGSPAGTPVLNGNQFDPRVGWGYELNAIRHRVRNSAYDVEARYFAVYGNNATVGPFNVPAGSVGLYATPGFYGAPSITTATFSSQLQNFELNVRHFRGPSVQLLTGFRWVELDDYLTISDNFAVGGGGVTTQRMSAINRLFGGQIGADVFLWQRGRLSIDGIGKAGIYGNAISSNLLITQTGAGTMNFQSAGNAGQTAFVGELGLTGRYRLTNKCSLRATYQLLWLDGVARGTDQVPNYNLAVAPATGPAAISTNTVFYNGMFLGAESQF